ncbi:MAG: ZIP family metal transporter [Candidatus Faecimonas sp.]|nr:ZIP family metal transporter [Mycoplasmatota bacterium]MDY2908307.1 ZIP family metal transporter [Candidatus Faecimonas sp.]
MIGVLPVFISNYKEEKIIPAALLFASGVMLTISFLSLIPEGFTLFFQNVLIIPSILFTAIFVVLGIGFSAEISRKIEEKLSFNYLYRLGIIAVIALIFHNIPEGITTFLSSRHDLSLGLTLSLGIALHNIPEGISVAVPIYYATKSRKKAIIFTFISGFSETIGAIIAYLFLAPFITSFILGLILSIAAGIMIHISIYELIPTSFKYQLSMIMLLFFVFGVFIMVLCHFII